MLDDAVLDELLAMCAKRHGNPHERGGAEATLLGRAGAFQGAFSVSNGEVEVEERGVVVRGPAMRTVEGPPLDPTLPWAELAFLLERGAIGREIVAGHPSTPDEVQVMLATDPIENVRRRLARQPRTCVAALEILAEDWPLASCVASNPNAPPRLLHMVMRRAWWKELTDNPSSDATVLRYLSTKPDVPKDQAKELRYALARHPNTPQDVLERLLVDANLKAVIDGRPKIDVR